MLGAVGIADSSEPVAISGTLYPLGLELRQHSRMASLVVYGLLVNAPLEAIRQAFPEYAQRANVNGHLRRLVRMSELTRASGAGRKTLLLCTSGIAI